MPKLVITIQETVKFIGEHAVIGYELEQNATCEDPKEGAVSRIPILIEVVPMLIQLVTLGGAIDRRQIAKGAKLSMDAVIEEFIQKHNLVGDQFPPEIEEVD